jgi:hypothetical protein
VYRGRVPGLEGVGGGRYKYKEEEGDEEKAIKRREVDKKVMRGVGLLDGWIMGEKRRGE